MDTNRHESPFTFSTVGQKAFTLLELTVVIAIILVLAGLLVPTVQSILERAKKVQAKNDLSQIVTAVNAFYTEYGRYPTTATTDVTFFTNPSNDQLLDVLRNNTTGGNATLVTSLNSRQIVFISPPEDPMQLNPKGKIGSDQQFHDPWGNAYAVRLDANYDNQVSNPYGSGGGAGPDPLRQGVISWSVGKDANLGSNGSLTSSDDVISWQ